MYASELVKLDKFEWDVHSKDPLNEICTIKKGLQIKSLKILQLIQGIKNAKRLKIKRNFNC